MKRVKLSSGKLMLQYFFSYLVLMLLILSLLLAFAYSSFYKFHAEKLSSNYLSELELLRKTNEAELSQLMAMSSMFTTSSDFSPFVYAQEPEKAVRLIRQLSVYRASNNFMRSLYLMFYDDEYVYSPTGSYSLDNFINKASCFEKIGKEDLLVLLENTARLNVLPEQNITGYLFNTQKIVTRVIPIFIPITYSGSVRCGTALYLVDKQTYSDMFVGIISSEKDVYILRNNDVLVERNVSGVPYAQVLSVAAVTGSGESSPLRYEGEGYRLLRLNGDAMGYDYVMLVPDSELSVAMAGSMQALFFAAAFISALGLVVITLFVQSRIKPIRLLHSMLSTQAPTGNELLEIRQSVQKLIDENAELNTRMENVVDLRKADFARRFLNASFTDTNEYLSLAEGVQLNVDMPYFIVCILAKPSETDYDISPDKLNCLFEQEVSGVARAFADGSKSVMIVFAFEEDALFTWIEGKFDGMRACCVGLTMAVSTVHATWQEGALAYLESERAFENRFLQGNTKVIRFDECQEGSTRENKARHKSIERLHTALRSGDGEQVSRALERVSGDMRSMNTSLFVFRCMYNDILHIITGEARAVGIEDQEMFDLFSFSQCLSLEDLDVLLRNACRKLIEKRSSKQQTAEIPADIARAMEMIERRFSEPGLSVSQIALELGIGDSRLSVEFKKAYQITPMECLTAHRMRLARRLLNTTRMPVKDIAIECGYYEISGFNRRFKAYTGMTPQQYRQSHEGKAGEIDE